MCSIAPSAIYTPTSIASERSSDSTRRCRCSLSVEIEAAVEGSQMDLRRFQRNNAIYSRLLPIDETSGLYRVRHALRRGLEAMR